MSSLPSGLPIAIADQESLARFLMSSSWFSGGGARIKYPAFLPAPDNESSVYRIDELSPERIRECGFEAAGERTLHGAAVVAARACRKAGLEASSYEPPSHHANLIKWPVCESDPELQKSQRKLIATEIAEEAKWLPVHNPI